MRRRVWVDTFWIIQILTRNTSILLPIQINFMIFVPTGIIKESFFIYLLTNNFFRHCISNALFTKINLFWNQTQKIGIQRYIELISLYLLEHTYLLIFISSKHYRMSIEYNQTCVDWSKWLREIFKFYKAPVSCFT